MSAQKFRKKPVVIEAVRFGGSSTDVSAINHWMEGGEYVAPTVRTADMVRFMAIETPEGVVKAKPGDWIIKGVAGEFYPCKNEIFWATYEPADADVPVPEVSDGEASCSIASI